MARADVSKHSRQINGLNGQGETKVKSDIPGFILMCALAVTLAVLFARAYHQQLVHKERMTALEKGVAVPSTPAPAPWSPRVYLLRGLIWSLAGAALAICLFGISSTSQRRQSYESKAYEAHQLAHDLDIPLDQAMQVVEKDQAAKTQGPPTTIALLGLIPLAVGLAYLVFYYTDPSRKLGAGQS
jgi:hypothetical protein